MQPRTLILRSAGTNCDVETAYAFELAGAETSKVHINRLLEAPNLLDDYQILALPGGFSYGDDIAAGRILANQIVHHLRDALTGFVAAGKPVIGICNGFQVLVKTDLLPGTVTGAGQQSCTLAHNVSGRFVDRWVSLTPKSNKCIWTRKLPERIELPIAHGEGRFVAGTADVQKELWSSDQVALVYANGTATLAAGGTTSHNPNGSADDIAGVCDSTGLVLGLMPHPERSVDPTQHPAWTRARPERGAGLQFFENAVLHVKEALGAGV